MNNKKTIKTIDNNKELKQNDLNEEIETTMKRRTHNNKTRKKQRRGHIQ